MCVRGMRACVRGMRACVRGMRAVHSHLPVHEGGAHWVRLSRISYVSCDVDVTETSLRRSAH